MTDPVNRRPSEREVAARLSEVEERYGRQEKAARERRGDKKFVRRRWELLKLFRARGLDDDQARAQLDELGDLAVWSPASLGQVLTPPLTFAEKVRLDIRTIQCADQSPEFVAAFFADLRRERDRLDKRQKRAAAPKPTKALSRRAEVLKTILMPREPRSDLAGRAADLQEYRDRSGRPLQPETCLQRVRRALDELAKAGIVTLETGQNDHGQPVKIVVRR